MHKKAVSGIYAAFVQSTNIQSVRADCVSKNTNFSSTNNSIQGDTAKCHISKVELPLYNPCHCHCCIYPFYLTLALELHKCCRCRMRIDTHVDSDVTEASVFVTERCLEVFEVFAGACCLQPVGFVKLKHSPERKKRNERNM